MHGNRLFFLFAASTWAFASTVPLRAENVVQLEEIVVTASLRRETLADIPVSTTVLEESVLGEASVRHFADVLGLVPNLNWSGGTSRPRYFQVRGIGELEQYQGAPNPSVGFLIDEIDLSGVGMPATLFDVEQVEVLRGPQGTRYGANALAGLIKVKTRDPDGQADLDTQLVGGEDGIFGIAVAGGGPLGPDAERAAWRVAAQSFEADGFRHNAYLDRDDTNHRDEVTVRGKVRLQPLDAWRIDLAGFYVDLDNGFDAFVPDNSLTMLSDRPGRDAQRSVGGSVVVEGDLGPASLTSATAAADSDIVYSFDGDWGNDPYWGEYAPYDYLSRFDRERRTLSEDLRLTSRTTAESDGFGWIAGLYALRLEETNLQRDYFADEPLRVPLESDYEARNLAAYGQWEFGFANDWTLSTGLRVENRAAEYEDSDGARFSPDETMVGGHLSLTKDFRDEVSGYATLSRGYKAGGFNIGQLVPDDRREFSAEYLWNLEAGLRWFDDERDLSLQLALFHMWRSDQQVATSFQIDPGDPLSYVFYTDNAASGRNYGLEASLDWAPVEALRLGMTLGLLESEYLDYEHGDRDLDGREQAHAPGYQYSLSLDWRPWGGWGLRADLVGSDAFYFDASHDQRSEPYRLVNLQVGYSGERWAAYAWGRNVFDEEYAVRGFFFGLEPPDYANELYVQRGDPQHFGLTVEWKVR
jgi:outer membrane receptor protein involved in Fe transport